MASEQTTHSSIAPGTPTQGKGYHLIGSGAIRNEAITHAFFTTKVASSHTSVVTDQEHWNEELLLQFYATLHIRGYNRDPKTWVLEWMTGNIHHEAKAFDIIELTGLPTPGELFEPGYQLHQNELQSVF